MSTRRGAQGLLLRHSQPGFWGSGQTPKARPLPGPSSGPPQFPGLFAPAHKLLAGVLACEAQLETGGTVSLILQRSPGISRKTTDNTDT